MNTLYVTGEQIRNARPDCISDIGQISIGQVIVGFETYQDIQGRVNQHFSYLAVVTGSAYRITDEHIIDRGIGLGKHIKVEPLPTFTRNKPTYVSDPSLLRIGNKAIQGVDQYEPPAGLGSGFLVVREEPYQVEANLEIGPGLYVNGSNDYAMLGNGRFMAVALDTDPRLNGEL